MNVLVTGSYGQLGSEISALASDYKEINLPFTDIDTLDITSKKDILHYVNENKIELIINCAPKTKTNKPMVAIRMLLPFFLEAESISEIASCPILSRILKK